MVSNFKFFSFKLKLRSIKTLIRKKSKSFAFAKGLQIALIMKKARLVLNDFFPKELQTEFEVYSFDLKTGNLIIKTFNPMIASEIRLNEPKIQNYFKKYFKINLKKISIRSY